MRNAHAELGFQRRSSWRMRPGSNASAGTAPGTQRSEAVQLRRTTEWHVDILRRHPKM
jgi:hypothetical protein